MNKARIIITGEKETFLIRALEKKITDAHIPCQFVTFTVNDINASWEGTSLVIIYIENGFSLSSDVLHFLSDKMMETGVQAAIIGEDLDLRRLKEKIPGEVIYKSYVRPVDNEAFVRDITGLYNKIEAGEFRKTILIVDDDPNYLSVVREWLKGTYKVAMANSGLQAIKWLGKNKADLILLDYEMPVTSGPQVLEMLRSDSDTADIPVMFLTGKSDKNSVMSVLELKPEGYFLKTIDKDELCEKLKHFFILHR